MVEIGSAADKRYTSAPVTGGGFAPEGQDTLDTVYHKIARRVLPFLILLYSVAWLDRVNVGFAKLQMSRDLGFSEAVYGFGAGIFYLGYLLFEIPSNLLLQKVGARKTIARIALLWGATSVAMLWVKSATSFYALRFLLGVFEAGLYPGVLLYLTYWFPAPRRARMTGLFMTAVPLAGIFGGPLSGWIMNAMGGRAGGLANWQWLFLLEGIPSVIMAFVTLAFVVDGPSHAPWLTPHEKQRVLADIEEDHQRAGPRAHGLAEAFRNPRVWLLTVTYFCLAGANATLGFWGPTIISNLGVSNKLTIGLLSAVPYLAGVVGILWVSRHSDRTLERRWHAAASSLAAAAGLIFVGVFAHVPVLAFAALVLGVTGVLSSFAPFWQLPTTLLAGTAAAGGIALINSFGNLSGWVGPFVVGWLADVTGSTASGLYVVAMLQVVAAVLIVAQKGARGTAAR